MEKDGSIHREVHGDVYQLTVLNKQLGSVPGFVWKIGTERTISGKKFICSRIAHDNNAKYFYGCNRWSIYMMDKETGEEFKHVDYDDALIEVKYNLPKKFL
jgi:hypothetical protein